MSRFHPVNGRAPRDHPLAPLFARARGRPSSATALGDGCTSATYTPSPELRFEAQACVFILFLHLSSRMSEGRLKPEMSDPELIIPPPRDPLNPRASCLVGNAGALLSPLPVTHHVRLSSSADNSTLKTHTMSSCHPLWPAWPGGFLGGHPCPSLPRYG